MIEHVGDYSRIKLFAKEVKRVSKKYWIQTPYKHFPIEPHLVFPFFQNLPNNLQKIIAIKWKYSHFKIGNSSDEKILDEIKNIHLLNIKEMKNLFNDGFVIKENYFGLIKSLIAIKI